jgi:tetratricopeptide (TPR) repeat protein
MYDHPTPVSAVSDHTIFPEKGTNVLRGTYGIPGVIAEASFFTNPDEERRLKQSGHNRREAISYMLALEAFFEESSSPILQKNSLVNIPPFRVFQEAERMNEVALLWYEDYLRGNELMKDSSEKSLEQAFQFFTRSARSFPDSYVAAECHKNRSIISKKLGKSEEAIDAGLRALEFYICVEN